MGHGITATDNLFSVREMPWHRLVEPLPDYPSREEAQQIAHPWEPVEVPVFRRIPEIIDGEPTARYEEIPESKGIERSDNGGYLGTVNQSLGIPTNNDLWDVAEALQGSASDVKFETAGSLEGGRKVWILVRLNEPIFIAGDPNGGTLPFFALQSGYDQSAGAFRGQGLNMRIVCANTSFAADQEAKATGYEFSFRRSKNVRERIEEAKSIVSTWRSQVAGWQVAMEELAKIHITPDQQRLFVESFQPFPAGVVSTRTRTNIETAREQVRSILSGPTCEDIDLTAYGLVQAGLEWNQHYRRTQAKTDRGRMENRFKRAVLKDDRLGFNLIELAQEVALA